MYFNKTIQYNLKSRMCFHAFGDDFCIWINNQTCKWYSVSSSAVIINMFRDFWEKNVMAIR